MVVGCERDDVAGFVHKRHPLIEAIGERGSVEVSASQVIAVLGVGVVGSVGAPLQVEYPSRIGAFGIGAEDTRERET